MQQYFFETIQYDKNIPARIVVGYETLSDSFARMHWHREIELFYMINGHASFEGMGLTTTLESDGSLQLSFFQLDDPLLGSLRDKLKAADLNNLTPLQAFDLLREMKEELGL